MARKGQELSKEMLKELGFVDLIYDEKTDSYTLFRNWYSNHHSSGKRLKIIKITPHTQYHPYGNDFKSFRASFKSNSRNYCISFARFLWVWERGYIKDTEIVKYNDNATTHKISDYHLVDYRDHSEWKKSNQYTCIKEMVKKFMNGDKNALKWLE